jgi:cobalt transporter subunit CbtB
MSTAELDTVRDRFERARADLTPRQAMLALLFGAALGFTLLLLQEPMFHDAVHEFRHTTGITCH